MIIDCISDLHGFYPQLEGGDLLIVAGDLTARDNADQYFEFEEWLDKQDYLKKVVIAGNHDNFLVNRGHHMFGDAEYLEDSGLSWWGLKIWGSPWTKTFPGINPHCKAFTCDTEEELAEKWALIPDDTDILITHSPPFGIFDSVRKFPQDIPESCGSTSLSKWMHDKWNVFESMKINVFGHIHEHGGKNGFLNRTTFINASHVNERYQPVNKPIRVIL